jgi:SAM-dependent methyltransferase
MAPAPPDPRGTMPEHHRYELPTAPDDVERTSARAVRGGGARVLAAAGAARRVVRRPDRAGPPGGTWSRRAGTRLAGRVEGHHRAGPCGRIVVVPSWLAEDHEPRPDELTLVLDPGRAFGSGHHATTTLCLELLDELDLDGRRVADVGCGTGVLAIAAAARGADVVAVDVDPDAVEVTRDNAARNGVHLDARVGSVELVPPPTVVVANLVTDVIAALAVPAGRRDRRDARRERDHRRATGRAVDALDETPGSRSTRSANATAGSRCGGPRAPSVPGRSWRRGGGRPRGSATMTHPRPGNADAHPRRPHAPTALLLAARWGGRVRRTRPPRQPRRRGRGAAARGATPDPARDELADPARRPALACRRRSATTFAAVGEAPDREARRLGDDVVAQLAAAPTRRPGTRRRCSPATTTERGSIDGEDLLTRTLTAARDAGGSSDASPSSCCATRSPATSAPGSATPPVWSPRSRATA